MLGVVNLTKGSCCEFTQRTASESVNLSFHFLAKGVVSCLGGQSQDLELSVKANAKWRTWSTGGGLCTACDARQH